MLLYCPVNHASYIFLNRHEGIAYYAAFCNSLHFNRLAMLKIMLTNNEIMILVVIHSACVLKFEA